MSLFSFTRPTADWDLPCGFCGITGKKGYKEEVQTLHFQEDRDLASIWSSERETGIMGFIASFTSFASLAKIYLQKPCFA